jgi:hypothetical protein
LLPKKKETGREVPINAPRRAESCAWRPALVKLARKKAPLRIKLD